MPISAGKCKRGEKGFQPSENKLIHTITSQYLCWQYPFQKTKEVIGEFWCSSDPHLIIKEKLSKLNPVQTWQDIDL